jgi:DNA-directed RNA polymerase beta subunit
MSPLGFPSRMTMGKMIEIVLGKVACLEPDESVLDTQEFHRPISDHMKCMERILVKFGFQRSGKEIFCDGRTGEVIEAPLLSGKVSYTKLHHLVSKKMHARAKGPVDILTRQPTEGRSNHGGLRFGPMEIECTVAHAAAEILRERTLTAADNFYMFVCRQCGLAADGNEQISYYFCRFCGTAEYITKVNISYTSKLMMQELNALGIKVTFKIVT